MEREEDATSANLREELAENRRRQKEIEARSRAGIADSLRARPVAEGSVYFTP